MEQRRRTLAASLMLLLWALVISACFCSGFNFSSFAGGQKYSLRRQFWTQKPPIFEQSGCSRTVAAAGQGFGTSPPKRKRKDGTANGKKPSQKRRDVNFNSSTSSSSPPLSSSSTTIRNRPLVKSEQEELLSNLAIKSSKSIIGQTVSSSVELLRQRLSNISSDSTSSEDATKLDIDPFWELIPSLLTSKFPLATNEQLQRVAGFIRYALLPRDILPLEQNIIQNKWRPHEDIHAYMPQLDNEEGGAPPPFLKPNQIELCSKLEQNYNVILQEYDALIRHMEESGIDRFQSVTSMNYESGWSTLVLFYNGHRIRDFPYHLCPVTASLMETVPIAGRIAGFNRQKSGTGIPLHSDGNNMWLTCQMGLKVPNDRRAYIRVGPETRYWENGKCLLYDTTYEHETMNESCDEERVVLHVDLFNTVAMTSLEIEVMQYIYGMRERFMEAEGLVKVGSHIL